MLHLFENAPNSCCTGAREAGLAFDPKGRRAPGEQVVRQSQVSRKSQMKKVFAGVVSSCQLHRFEKMPESKPGLLLRPTEEWATSIIVGAAVKLHLPNGKEYQARIKGFEIPSMIPKDVPVALLIEEMPELDNEVPVGTKVFVEETE
jgi:hypothetical protein